LVVLGLLFVVGCVMWMWCGGVGGGWGGWVGGWGETPHKGIVRMQHTTI